MSDTDPVDTDTPGLETVSFETSILETFNLAILAEAARVEILKIHASTNDPLATDARAVLRLTAFTLGRLGKPLVAAAQAAPLDAPPLDLAA